MLSDRDLALLTGYVDGELTDRQRRHAERLLRASEEARALLAELQADSRHLINLPRVSAPADLHRSVMAAIGKSRCRPAPRPRPAAARTFPTWTGWAAAAAVLFVIGVGTFIASSRPAPDGGGVVKKAKPGEGGGENPGARDADLAKNTSPGGKDRKEPPSREPEDDSPTPDREPEKTPEKRKPIDDSKPEDPGDRVFGDGGQDGTSKIERVELALPVVFKLYDLSNAEQARKLREQLAAAPAHRVELLAKNASSLPKEAPRAFDRIKAALDARKIGLLIDSTAQANLKRPQFRHDYALFVENVTPAELVDLLAAVGAADRAAAEKKPADARFDGSLVVKGMSAWDRKELSDMIGTDPVKSRPTEPKPPGIDIRKPISEGTSKLVDDVLDGKRPAVGAAKPERSVLVLPLGASRRSSAEVKRYLESRQPAKAGTVQALIVLRTLP